MQELAIRDARAASGLPPLIETEPVPYTAPAAPASTMAAVATAEPEPAAAAAAAHYGHGHDHVHDHGHGGHGHSHAGGVCNHTIQRVEDYDPNDREASLRAFSRRFGSSGKSD